MAMRQLWRSCSKRSLLLPPPSCNRRWSHAPAEPSSASSSSSAPFSTAKLMNEESENLREASAQMPASAHSGPSIGRRFYKSAYAAVAPPSSSSSSETEEGGYVVMLDHRILKTPSKKPLKVPSFALAHAIAAEWEYQDQEAIRPFTMPLMKLTSTAIDKVPNEREKIIKNLLEFFHTDAVCCRDKVDSPLGELQAEMLNPLLDWVEKEFGHRPSHSSSILVDNQPDEVVEALEKALREADNWQLTAVDALSAASKSLVVAMAVSRGRLSIDEAIQIIRLEEDFQIEEWGLVEGGHDIDIADVRCRVAAASVFLRLL